MERLTHHMRIANITKTGFLRDSPFIYYTYGGERVPPSASRYVHLAKDSTRERLFRNAIGFSRVPRKASPKCIHLGQNL